VDEINNIIKDVQSKKERNHPLFRVPLLEDPSPKAVEMCIAAIRYFTKSRQYNVTGEDLKEIHSRAVELIETLKKNAPLRNGAKEAKSDEYIRWNIRKIHTLLHKVRLFSLLIWLLFD
jgi:hypothetical protein